MKDLNGVEITAGKLIRWMNDDGDILEGVVEQKDFDYDESEHSFMISGLCVSDYNKIDDGVAINVPDDDIDWDGSPIVAE